MPEGVASTLEHKPPEVKPNLLDLRRQIIESVLKNGLKSTQQLKREALAHLPSMNGLGGVREVEGCVIKPPTQHPNQESFNQALQNVLYPGDHSIFPVLIERGFDPSNLDYFYGNRYGRHLTRMLASEKKDAEERMRSSFLVIYKFKPDELEDLEETEFLGEGDQDFLSPDDFAYLVFPREVYEEAKGLLNGRVPVKIVDKFVKRKVLGLKVNTFSVPDYETTLTEIAQELGGPIWIHAVRLPTETDMKLFSGT